MTTAIDPMTVIREGAMMITDMLHGSRKVQIPSPQEDPAFCATLIEILVGFGVDCWVVGADAEPDTIYDVQERLAQLRKTHGGRG